MTCFSIRPFFGPNPATASHLRQQFLSYCSLLLAILSSVKWSLVKKVSICAAKKERTACVIRHWFVSTGTNSWCLIVHVPMHVQKWWTWSSASKGSFSNSEDASAKTLILTLIFSFQRECRQSSGTFVATSCRQCILANEKHEVPREIFQRQRFLFSINRCGLQAKRPSFQNGTSTVSCPFVADFKLLEAWLVCLVRSSHVELEYASAGTFPCLGSKRFHHSSPVISTDPLKKTSLRGKGLILLGKVTFTLFSVSLFLTIE